MTITIMGEPVAKARPRYGKGRTYNPDAAAERAAAWEMKVQYPGPPAQDEVWVIVDFFVGTRRKVDIDNFLKYIFDAGNGVLWRDDSLITAVSAAIIPSDEPRTELRVLPGAYARTSTTAIREDV